MSIWNANIYYLYLTQKVNYFENALHYTSNTWNIYSMLLDGGFMVYKLETAEAEIPIQATLV